MPTPIAIEPSFVIEIKDNCDAIYSDGVAQVAIGFPVSKIFFFQSHQPVGSDGPKEIRRVTHTVTIPTVRLVEACKHVLGAVKSVEEQLVRLGNAQSTQLQKLLSDATPMLEAPVEQTPNA